MNKRFLVLLLFVISLFLLLSAVTCEVLSPHGKIRKGSVSKSLLMMKTLLKYNKIL